MSDNETPAAKGTATFTERELQLLGWAMQSLKSGPPEIDIDKLAKLAGMSNPRSAGNAWSKIKNKLMAGNPDGAATPKRGGAKKKVLDDGEEGEASPVKKTPRKRAAKNQTADGEASPTKKPRVKKAPASEAKVKEEDDASSEAKTDAGSVKADSVLTEAEEDVNDEV